MHTSPLICLALLASFTLSFTAKSATVQTAEPTLKPTEIGPANWYWGPANRWSWHNTRRIFPTAQVSRGNGPIAPLQEEHRDLSKITFTDPVTNKPMTIAGMLDSTYTDGFIVLHHGRIVSETYATA